MFVKEELIKREKKEVPKVLLPVKCVRKSSL